MQTWPIGTKFKTRGKHPRIGTVVDIYKTYNSEGYLVKTRHVAEYMVAGQVVTDYDVPFATVARGLIKE